MNKEVGIITEQAAHTEQNASSTSSVKNDLFYLISDVVVSVRDNPVLGFVVFFVFSIIWLILYDPVGQLIEETASLFVRT